ncbi:lactate utilization protein C [Alginatibacterium sediminis]|uniref:Lactate utilization protein C n=1 Tax=Alginatibacterium sediminis TaxID=2164068 RepID=A0A420ECX8_9ALTE|nr:lactate utilization protein [Alginatibacterium sediminis]RKF18589.1 lactate utilization protein C [Alginatibacterium sediminis]
MSSKANILGRLKSATIESSKNSELTPNLTSELSACSSTFGLEQFQQQLELSHAEVINLDNPNQIEAKLKSLIKDNAWKHGVWSSSTNPSRFLDVERQLSKSEILRQVDGSESKADYFHHFDFGLSFSEAAIAETGTIVLHPGTNESRSLSLIPPVHVVIVCLKQLHHNFEQFMLDFEQQGQGRPMPSNLILVSGPSKTADIQQTLAYGAHGPQRLIVITIAALED